MHASNLKVFGPDAGTKPLEDDEFVIDRIVDARRTSRDERTFLVRWHGYGKAWDLWITRAELMRNCAKEVRETEKARGWGEPQSEQGGASMGEEKMLTGAEHATHASAPPTGTDATTGEQETRVRAGRHQDVTDDEEMGEGEPTRAEFQQGMWHYWEPGKRKGRTRGGRLYPEHRYTVEQRESVRFQEMRAKHLRANPRLVAVVEAHLSRRC